LSQSELPLTFGLGKPQDGKTVSIEIVWPSGQKDTIPEVKPNQCITVKEGKGIISTRPIVFSKTSSPSLPYPLLRKSDEPTLLRESTYSVGRESPV